MNCVLHALVPPELVVRPPPPRLSPPEWTSVGVSLSKRHQPMLTPMWPFQAPRPPNAFHSAAAPLAISLSFSRLMGLLAASHPGPLALFTCSITRPGRICRAGLGAECCHGPLKERCWARKPVGALNARDSRRRGLGAGCKCSRPRSALRRSEYLYAVVVALDRRPAAISSSGDASLGARFVGGVCSSACTEPGSAPNPCLLVCFRVAMALPWRAGRGKARPPAPAPDRLRPAMAASKETYTSFRMGSRRFLRPPWLRPIARRAAINVGITLIRLVTPHSRARLDSPYLFCTDSLPILFASSVLSGLASSDGSCRSN